MGLTGSKDYLGHRKIDTATSNSSLSNLRYVMTPNKSKWKMFKKREPIPTYAAQLRPQKGCPCGNKGPCKQRITPKGVTIHYPQKKKKFAKFPAKSYLPSKSERGYNNKLRIIRGSHSKFKRAVRKDFSFPMPFFMQPPSRY